MCFICAMRLRRLRKKGYITEAQIEEVTNEINHDFEKAMKAINDPEKLAKLEAVLAEGMVPNMTDFMKIMMGDKTKAGITDELVAKMLNEYKYDPGKVN